MKKFSDDMLALHDEIRKLRKGMKGDEIGLEVLEEVVNRVLVLPGRSTRSAPDATNFKKPTMRHWQES